MFYPSIQMHIVNKKTSKSIELDIEKMNGIKNKIK